MGKLIFAGILLVIIQQQYLARWDGRLPQYSLGAGAEPLVQLPGRPTAEGPRR